MEIVEVKATTLELPYPEEFRAAWRPDVVETSRPATIVQITTDEGIVGVGGSGRRDAALIREFIAPRLIGQNPFALERHADLLRQAGGGWIVDMALCDIVAKAAGLPLCTLWGVYQNRIRAYASLVTARPVEEVPQRALELQSQGFQAVKIRAHYETLADDVRMVELVREAVGDSMEIMVDANQAGAVSPSNPVAGAGVTWDLARATATAREYEQLGVLWLEEPLPRYQFENLSRLRDAVGVPIAGGEGNVGLHEFYWMLRDGAYDIVQPDATTSEGLSQLRKVASTAELMGRQFIPHHGAGGIGLAAHLHLCATLRNSPWIEFIIDPPCRTLRSYQQLGGVLAEPLNIDKDGYLNVPSGSGLGVVIDEIALQRFATDTARSTSSRTRATD